MKLKFYYGVVSSCKTMQLLSIAHNYESCGYNVIPIKPTLDTRSEMIETRAGIPPRMPDIRLREFDSLSNYTSEINSADVILVDECQFMSAFQIDELREITLKRNIDVLCFGLRTDSNNHLFDASKRLFELSDEIIEVRTICSVCGKHAAFNTKITSDEQLIVPGWDTFAPRCYLHYCKHE